VGGLITDSDRDAIVKGLKEIEAEIDRDGPKWAGFKPELAPALGAQKAGV
jgi:hypothetical protein